MQKRIVIIFLSSLVLNCNIAMVWEILDLSDFHVYPYVLEGGSSNFKEEGLVCISSR